MSARRLPNAWGTRIDCDHPQCDQWSQTAQVYGSLHAEYLKTIGWLISPFRKRRHLCPKHGAEQIEADKAAAKDVARRKADKRARKAERVRRASLTPEQRKAEDKQRRRSVSAKKSGAAA